MNLSRPQQISLAVWCICVGLGLNAVEVIGFLHTADRGLAAAISAVVMRTAIIYALMWVGMFITARLMETGFDDLAVAALLAFALAASGVDPMPHGSPMSRGSNYIMLLIMLVDGMLCAGMFRVLFDLDSIEAALCTVLPTLGGIWILMSLLSHRNL